MRQVSPVTIRQVEFYAAGHVALMLNDAIDSVVENVRVVPRPGTDRLISSHADGIMIQNVRSRVLVRNNEIRRAGDDGIAINVQCLLFVDSSDQTSVTGQANWTSLRPANGAPVSFISAASGAVVGSARLVAQDPPNSNPLSYPARGTFRFSFDREIPPLPRDSCVTLADALDRGDGTVVEGNLISDAFMARGIYIAGPIGATVRNNTILRSPGSGILVDSVIYPRNWAFPPVERIDILSNRIEDAVRPGRDGPTGSANAFGAIQTIAALVIPGTPPTTARAHKSVRFSGNIVTGSGRSGIWASNTDGLTIQDNTIERSGLFASAPIYGWPSSDFTQLRQEFAKHIAVRNSDNVTGARK